MAHVAPFPPWRSHIERRRRAHGLAETPVIGSVPIISSGNDEPRTSPLCKSSTRARESVDRSVTVEKMQTRKQHRLTPSKEVPFNVAGVRGFRFDSDASVLSVTSIVLLQIKSNVAAAAADPT